MRTPVAPARRAASFVAGLTMVAVGQWRFANGQSGGWAFACWIVGLVVCVGAVGLPGGGAPDDARVRAAASTDPPRTGWASVRTLVPVAVSFGLGAFVWWQEWTRRNDAGRWDLLALWAASVLCLAAAMWQPSWVAIRSVSWRRWLGEHRTDVLTSVWLLIGALTLHVARLGSFPYVFNGDEGGFAVLSRDAVERAGFDPFAIGFMSHPQMYNVFQAGSMEVFGTDVTGARMVSAVLGSLAVPLMYLVGTRVVGSRRAGVIAAVLLLTLPVHLFWSRSALPNGASVFFALLVLLLCDRALVDGRARSFAAVGMAVGFAQFFYFSNRVLVVVALVALTVPTAHALVASRARVTVVRAWAVRIGLAAIGLLVVTGPVVAFHRANPGSFNGRVNQISLLWGDNLAAEAARRDVGELAVVWDHVVQAAMLPFSSAAQGSFRGVTPFVGGPVAVLGAIGVAIITAWCWRPRFSGAATVWWATVAGLAVTVGPAETNRWVMSIAVLCLGAGIASDAAIGLVGAAVPSRRRALTIAGALVVASIAVVDARAFFRDADQVEIWSDVNTGVAERLAHTIADVDDHAHVVLFAAPRMYFGGFRNLTFRVPGATGQDVPIEGFAESSSPPPAVRDAMDESGTTIFVAVPERSDELAQVQRWYPDGRAVSVRDESVHYFDAWIVER